MGDGRIKGLWVIATNGSHSWIQQNRFNGLMSKLEFLVVQDMYPTIETAQQAHLYLPAAGWGEKEGTLINSERRIGLAKKVGRAPGLALADYHIFQLIAQYWGCGELFKRWSSPEAAFQIIKELSRGQPCDITGINDYEMIDRHGGIQWPLSEQQASDWTTERSAAFRLQNRSSRNSTQPEGCVPNFGSTTHGLFRPGQKSFRERRLFEDRQFFHADGRARFIFESPREMPEKPDDEYPFLLLTGRGTSAQWHTGSRTEKSDVLRELSPAGCYVEVNPIDAAKLGIAPGRAVRVRSRRGELIATAFVTATVQPEQVFIPMHYAETNRLTLAVFDPVSRQPSYKACAVRLQAMIKPPVVQRER
jgi:assimilatory nitrate reductase catalytic subunit